MLRFAKPTVGRKFGCSDSGAPETHTPVELSRLYDALHAAEAAGLNPVEVFKLAPDSMKVEFNYSRWSYVPV